MPTVKQAQDKLDSILEHGGIDNALLALDEVSSMGGMK